MEEQTSDVSTLNSFGTQVAEINLTLSDVEAVLEAISFYLVSISRQTEVKDFYPVMKPLADKYAEVQWKLEQFFSQLKQMNNVTEQSEHL